MKSPFRFSPFRASSWAICAATAATLYSGCWYGEPTFTGESPVVRFGDEYAHRCPEVYPAAFVLVPDWAQADLKGPDGHYDMEKVWTWVCSGTDTSPSAPVPYNGAFADLVLEQDPDSSGFFAEIQVDWVALVDRVGRPHYWEWDTGTIEIQLGDADGSGATSVWQNSSTGEATRFFGALDPIPPGFAFGEHNQYDCGAPRNEKCDEQGSVRLLTLRIRNHPREGDLTDSLSVPTPYRLVFPSYTWATECTEGAFWGGREDFNSFRCDNVAAHVTEIAIPGIIQRVSLPAGI